MSKASIVVGLQWGDEGKGKIIDLLSHYHKVLVRACGGANAGHSLVVGDKELVTHILPSGVFHTDKMLYIGGGTVIDLDSLKKEIEGCENLGLKTTSSSINGNNLFISGEAHLVMPWHKVLDKHREEGKEQPIGTTKKGIGPCYEAKAARCGVRFGDLVDNDRFLIAVRKSIDYHSPELKAYGKDIPTEDEVTNFVNKYVKKAAFAKPFLSQNSSCISRILKKGVSVLIEGAQGALLDLDMGTYPYVTSSFTGAAGACQGAGIGPTSVQEVIGVTKAYCTRVGNGPFPSEMDDETVEEWRQSGKEYGATTGRPRRCGWIDLPALKKAVEVNGVTSIALTKLDILSGKGTIKAAIGYSNKGSAIYDFPPPHLIEGAVPVYEHFEGWDEDLSKVEQYEDLPDECKKFISYIEDFLEVRISIASVGPKREQTILM